MKSLKPLTLVALVVVTMNSLFAAEPRSAFAVNRALTSQDIEINNFWYATYLGDCDYQCDNLIMMNVIKQKALFPDCDYSELVKPLQRIVKKCRNNELKNLASITLAVINSETNFNLCDDCLYSQNADQFFAYVKDVLPRNLAEAK